MSEVVENVGEYNSAQSNAAEAPTETVADVTTNNVEADKAVPVAIETISSAKIENAECVSNQDAEKTTSPKVDSKKPPTKRTPSKRMSFIERAQKESEELVKNMGGSLEIEGGRRTRSSTRGTPTLSTAASTPPPVKKARTSPASGAATPPRPRGRGRKLDVADNAAEEEETKPTPSKKTPAKVKKAAAKDVASDEVVEKPEESKQAEEKTEEKIEKVDSTGTNLITNELKETSVSSKETNEITDKKVVEKPEEDQTDSALESLVEETENQVAANALPTARNVTKEPVNTSLAGIVSEVSESVKSDSSMETEDVKAVGSVLEKNEAKPEEKTPAVVEAVQNVKEPTPEPMEVDSNSKSNDALEKMDEDVIEIIEERKIVQEPSKVVENEKPITETNPANVSELKNLEKVENIKVNSAVLSTVAATPAGLVANNLIAKPNAVTTGIPSATENSTEETTHATVSDSNKTENDLCEPKIATSHPISTANDNSTITTPQTCN